MANEGNVILEVKNLKKYFKVGNKDILKAVDNVSFAIKEGETLGLVGESGCGKTTCGRTVIGMYDKTDGEVLYKGKPVHGLKGKAKRDFTKEVQIIFQDPYASLNPRMTVADIIAEGIDIHGLAKDKEDRTRRVYELLDQVGLNREHANRFVHEFSGGQRQRIGIARALAVEPKFILCDEPISALDVSIQAQILNLLMDLQDELNLSYMFVTHDLSVVKHISDNIMVMYLGICVEFASSDELFDKPLHPYTQVLLEAIPEPTLESRAQPFTLIKGEVTSPINPKPGCRFAGRCEYCMPQCHEKTPEYIETLPGHFVACHKVNGR